jgi:hypothetical protein
MDDIIGENCGTSLMAIASAANGDTVTPNRAHRGPDRGSNLRGKAKISFYGGIYFND